MPRKRWRCGSACASGLEAYGLEALHERSYSSKFYGSQVLKSIKRSVINIRRSMFNVQSVHCSGQAEFHIRCQAARQ
jgi:hypothetical protein